MAKYAHALTEDEKTTGEVQKGTLTNEQPTEVEAFTPIFGAKTRTVIYVLGVVASIIGLGFLTFGDAAVGGYISTVAGFVASSFGVAYNPLRRS